MPVTAPSLDEIWREMTSGSMENCLRISRALVLGIGPAPGGKYHHWDRLRRGPHPHDLTPREHWAAIKFARSQTERAIPLLDAEGGPFQYCTPDPLLDLLHEVDREASGRTEPPGPVADPRSRARYAQTSIMEEAISSSQLEGAATTRDQARDLIRRGRRPATRDERMILNNYRAMERIRTLTGRPLTPDVIFDIHGTIAEGTLPEHERAPYLRKPGSSTGVYDGEGRLLHEPPRAEEIPQRLDALCEFANRPRPGPFLHPIVKAIILHFWLAYDHPFVDGNGRVARALFYWSMISDGYWLMEFTSISSRIRKAPSEYGRSFLLTETDENDLTYFILSQLRTIRAALGDLRGYLARKTDESRRMENLIHASALLNHRQVDLLGHAFRHPGTRYTIASHRRSHGVTYQTARTDLLSLAEAGLLIKSRSGKAFVFTAPDDLAERLRGLR